MKLRLRRADRVEEVACVERTVAEELVGATVPVLGAGLGDHVHYGAGVASVFGLNVREHRDLGECVYRKDRRRSSEDAALVQDGQVAVPVVHVGTIKQIVIGAS